MTLKWEISATIFHDYKRDYKEDEEMNERRQAKEKKIPIN